MGKSLANKANKILFCLSAQINLLLPFGPTCADKKARSVP